MPLALRIFTFAMNVEVVSEGGSVDDALATFAICLTLASVGGLIVAAELHLHGIAKYFGFLAFRAGRAPRPYRAHTCELQIALFCERKG